MSEIILNYWLEWACGVVAAAILALWRWVRKRFKAIQEENKSTKDGIKAILHDRLFQAHRYYMDQGYCPLEDKKNIEYLYKPYAALGGNGTGLVAYKDICNLPSTPPDKRKSRTAPF